MLERLAKPLGGLWNGAATAVNAFFRVLGTPGKLLQDLLNGVWLGHPLHPVLTDVVVGAATAALFLDLLRLVFGIDGLAAAATWTLLLAWLAAVGSILSGLTDFKDTAPKSASRNVAGLHGLVNIAGTALFFASLTARWAANDGLGFWLLLVAFVLIGTGAFIGGHIVFTYGEMVNHNAFSRGKRAKEFTPILPAADLPDAAPTRATLGATALVLVRRGDVVHALKDTCSHAGGPLSEGSLDGDAITCPWHGSAFRLADGAVRHGPATTRQVAYRARINDGQVEVSGPRG